MIEYIGNRLVAWAAWCERRQSGGLGYPRQAAFTKLAHSGGERFDATLVIDEEAWEIEQAVCATMPELRAVAMAVYRVRGTGAQAAALVGCSERTLYRRIDALHQAVMDWLLDYHSGRQDGQSERRVRQQVSRGEAGGRAGASGTQQVVVG